MLFRSPFDSHACAWNEEFIEELEGGMRLELPKYAPAEIQELMGDCCWNAVPEKRPPFTEIKRRISSVLQAHTDYTELLCEEDYQWQGEDQGQGNWLPVRNPDPHSAYGKWGYGYGFARRKTFNSNPYGIIRRASPYERERKTPRIAERPSTDADLY